MSSSPLDGSAARFWKLRDGAGGWQRITTRGLPHATQVVEATPGGGFLAYQMVGGAMEVYRSTDLSVWSRVRIP